MRIFYSVFLKMFDCIFFFPALETLLRIIKIGTYFIFKRENYYFPYFCPLNYKTNAMLTVGIQRELFKVSNMQRMDNPVSIPTQSHALCTNINC